MLATHILTPSLPRTIEEIKTVLGTTYGLPSPSYDFPLNKSLQKIGGAFGGDLSRWRDLTVLDLGCGGCGGSMEIRENPGMWSPWFLRGVAVLGAHGVGVDIAGNADRENLKFYQWDLRNPTLLQSFSPASFDVINCSNLLSSPHLVYRLTNRDDSQRKALLELLEFQIPLLLKSSGIVIEFDKDLNGY